jgi:hypothetical protein
MKVGAKVTIHKDCKYRNCMAEVKQIINDDYVMVKLTGKYRHVVFAVEVSLIEEITSKELAKRFYETHSGKGIIAIARRNKKRR